MKLKPIAKTVLRFADKHLPEILSIAALVGLGGAVVSATKKAPKAVEALEEAREEKAQKMLAEDAHSLDIYQDKAGNPDISQIKLNPWEWFKAEAPVYWDTWLVAAATGACIILSNRIGARRYAALLAALSLNKKQLEEWKEKAKEVLGEKKVKEIEGEISKDQIMDMPEEVKAKYSDCGPSTTYPCFLKFSNTWIYGNTVAIERAFNLFNSQYLMRNGYATVSDLYYAISEYCNIIDDNFKYDSWLSSRTGWEYDGVSDDMLKPDLSYGSTVEGIPCLIVDTSRPTDKFDL